MNELSQEARSLLEAERAQGGATPADRERLRGKLARELGTAAFAVGALAASASHAGEALGQATGTTKVASVSLTLTTKLAGAALCALALAGSVLLWRAQVAPEQHAQRPAPVLVAPAPVVQPAPVVVQPVVEPPARAAETPAPRSVRRAKPALVQQAPGDGLALELALLTRAQRALHEGRHEQALALADEHTRSFAQGAMRSEALGIAALAHCALGQHDAPAVRTFLASAPTSPLAARVREACGAK